MPCVESEVHIQITDDKWKMNAGKLEREKVIGANARRIFKEPVPSFSASKERSVAIQRKKEVSNC